MDNCRARDPQNSTTGVSAHEIPVVGVFEVPVMLYGGVAEDPSVDNLNNSIDPTKVGFFLGSTV